MRLSGIAIVSVIVGTCAAVIPVPSRTMQPIPIERARALTKPQVKLPGHIDPELNSRLDSLEEQERQLRDVVSKLAAHAGVKRSE